MTIDVYIAMGSNLGDRRAHIKGGLAGIDALDSCELLAASTMIETEPVGPEDQGAYLNGVVHIKTGLSPRRLLEELLKIEARFGRDRTKEIRWGARTLDLDILIYGDELIDEPGLSIPHPRLHTRGFVLVPLCEIAPEIKVPGHEKTPRALLRAFEESLISE